MISSASVPGLASCESPVAGAGLQLPKQESGGGFGFFTGKLDWVYYQCYLLTPSVLRLFGDRYKLVFS